MTNPNEPTLTCSEVVERLAKCVGLVPSANWNSRQVFPSFNRAEAEAILHSWRERRVQELEELLAKHPECSHCADSASDDIEREDGDGNS